LNAAPVKVLFIGGFGRSGSTLLDNVLGQVEGFSSCGEISYTWDRSIQEDRLCSCRNPFSACPFWGPIVAAAFPELESLDLDQMVAVRESLTPRRAAMAAWRGLEASDLPGVGIYSDQVVALLQSIREATGGRVIVDSSKAPGHGFLLRSSPNVDAYVLHLVRDARAVAHSWQKKKIYDPTGEEPMLMSRHSPARSSKLWNTWNVATEMVWRRSPERYLRVRYEDFVDAPDRALSQILSFVGEPGVALPLLDGNTFEMGPIHALAGNPSRFKDGPIEIRRDDRWESEQPRSHRATVSALTWPLLLRYGYLG
jgi:hypothetical protein